ncbi:MAG: DUF3179 domain-containing protein [Nitrospiraceae bacterium]|nr:MAG: DUF3179 domain-containing protein [Nitrospiraceae bacterium]
MFIFAIIVLAPPSLNLFASSWDFSRHSIPVDEIQSGGPPRDGIPALFDPKFVAADKADFMRDDEMILGVFHNGIARAFPTRIMSWHELVNLNFGDTPVLVSW